MPPAKKAIHRPSGDSSGSAAPWLASIRVTAIRSSDRR